MTSKKFRAILKSNKGSAFPLTIAVTLALLLLLCVASEGIRLMIIAQGVRDAVQSAVISTVNDSYDNVYHGVREGYSGAYQPSADEFAESLDYPDGDSQLAWVRWTTPSTPQTMTIRVSVSGRGMASEGTITAKIVDISGHDPPDPVADDRNNSYTASPVHISAQTDDTSRTKLTSDVGPN